MQELISLLKKETCSEDHYIIDKIPPLVLNSRIDELFLQANIALTMKIFQKLYCFII